MKLSRRSMRASTCNRYSTGIEAFVRNDDFSDKCDSKIQTPMSLLSPDWNQPMPTPEEAHTMCRLVPLAQIPVSEANLVSTIQELCRSHANGGALLAAFEIGPNSDFDWFASRNRLLEFDILPLLLARREVRDALPALKIPDFRIDWSRASLIESANGFEERSSFKFDSKLSHVLFHGGAYPSCTVAMEEPRRKRRCASAKPPLA